MNDLLKLPLFEIAGKIKAREVSPVALAEAALARIDSTEGALNAYVRVNREQAMAAARTAFLIFFLIDSVFSL